MDALGININILFTQLSIFILLLIIPITTLLDLRKKNLAGTPLAVWTLTICIIPVLGSLAYWIVKPSNESR